MEKDHICKVYVDWTEKKMGIVRFEDERKGEVAFSVPPEFMGHHHIVTPEDLFLSSVLTCLASYFFNMASRSRLKFVSFRSCAKSKLLEMGPDYIFSDIEIDVNIRVRDRKEEHKARRAMEVAERGCYVANSITSKVIVKKIIEIVEENKEKEKINPS